MAEAFAVKFRDPVFAHNYDPAGFELKPGTTVLAETERGLELGRVVRGPFEVPDQTLMQPLMPILRLATEADLKRDADNRAVEQEAYAICNDKFRQSGLAAKLVATEYNFNRSRLQVFFTSEDKVDYRELVKELAQCFSTRLQLTRIGARDHAKLLGGCGVCGRELCCSTWLKNLEPIGVKLAKEQHLPLTPTKISGVCGKLMCCLKYEYEFYREQNKKMPKLGKQVTTPRGDGVVDGLNVFTEEVTVRLHEGGRHTCPSKDVCPKHALAKAAIAHVKPEANRPTAPAAPPRTDRRPPRKPRGR